MTSGALLRLARHDRAAAIASSAEIEAQVAFRLFLSGPWQAKQFSARIGRMSRLKLHRLRLYACGGWLPGPACAARFSGACAGASAAATAGTDTDASRASPAAA